MTTTEQYDRDPDALAWARGKVQPAIDLASKYAAFVDDPEMFYGTVTRGALVDGKRGWTTEIGWFRHGSDGVELVVAAT